MSRDYPLVSVVMTVYNGEKYLDEAVDSILSQTYSNFEFIIVDDCSTDRTAEIIKSKKDSRIRYFKNTENKGIFSSANYGISKALGKYIARMDADDISHPQRIGAQVKFMEANYEIGLCGTESISFSEEHQFLQTRLPLTHDAICAYFLFGNPIIHPSIMIRTEMVKQHEIVYDESYVAAGDLAYYLSMWDKTKIMNIPKPYLKYRIHSKNTTKLKKSEQGLLSRNESNKFFKYVFANLSDVDDLLNRHLLIISKELNEISDFDDLVSWCRHLTKLNGDLKKFNHNDFLVACSHFLYRKAIRNKFASFELLFLVLKKYRSILSRLPFAYQLTFIYKCLRG